MARLFLIFGGVFAFMAVAGGAFGTHGLKSRISAEMLSVFEIGVRYQMYHALALIATAYLHLKRPSWFVVASGWLFVIGIILFSGSLYLLSLGGLAWLGPMTPMGGFAFLLGWLFIVVAALKR
jgi:uncharacterized membrane protein YgdD (TMEM256/DUF423 family)